MAIPAHLTKELSILHFRFHEIWYIFIEERDHTVIVIGLMSGTSVDGIDAVVVQLTGPSPFLDCEVLKRSHRSFVSELRAEIFACSILKQDQLTALPSEFCPWKGLRLRGAGCHAGCWLVDG